MGVWSLRSSLGLSVVVHALFLLACAFLLVQRPAHIPTPNLAWVEIVRSPRERKPPKQIDKSAEIQQKQMVVTERGRSVETASDQAFLGERNQVVREETVGRSQAFGGSQKKTASAPKTTTPEALPRIGRLGDLAMPIIPKLNSKEQLTPEMDRNWAGENDSAQRVQDYVKGLNQSEHTALNTREYVFFGYFQRIRERLDRAWVPILREKLTRYHYSGRRLASDKDHSTQVLVILNQSGEITRVQITGESGSHDLDDAAVKAFNEAGPFPHPPRGIMDPNGEIKIPWEFILRT